MKILKNESKSLESLQLLNEPTKFNITNGINLILMDNGSGKTSNAKVLYSKLEDSNIDTKLITTLDDLTDDVTNNLAFGKDFLVRLNIFLDNQNLQNKKPILIIDDLLGYLDKDIIQKTFKLLFKSKLQIILFSSFSIIDFLDEDTKSFLNLVKVNK